VEVVFDAGSGRTLSYTRRGSGPLIVCVPGGTGDSSWPDKAGGYRIADYVDDVETLRIHLGLEQLTLYGNSHGGCVALAYATAYPQQVARFVITNSPSSIDDGYADAADEVQQRFIARFADGEERLLAAEESYPLIAQIPDNAEKASLLRRFMARYTANQGPVESAYLDRLCAAPMNYDSVDVMYEEFEAGLDLLDGVEQAVAPALVIGTEFDVVVPCVEMRRIADSLPNASFRELAGVGHFPEVESPQAFTSAMLEFLAG